MTDKDKIAAVMAPAKPDSATRRRRRRRETQPHLTSQVVYRL